MVSGYAGALRSDDPEVPSTLKYDVNGKGSNPVRWGYRVENDRTVKDPTSSWKKIVFPKLLLSSRAETKHFMYSAKTVGASIQKDGIAIVADFLKVLITQLNSDLSARLPCHVNVERFFCCGYPPAWPPGDVEKLATACRRAGMANIRLVSEPTAAATALLSTMSEQRLQSYGLHVGKTFLLIDAGGMTVETTVFKILEVSPIAVEQLTTGDGDYCGSGCCNLRFRKFIMQHARLKGLKREDREAIADYLMNADFEVDLKRNLRPDEPDQNYRIRLPPHLFPSLDQWIADAEDSASHAPGYTNEPHIILSRQEIIQEFMEESFQAIAKLALREIREAKAIGYQTSKIILTGGFGRNALLRQRIKEALWKYDKNAQVIQPSLQTGAVSQGIMSMAFNHSAVKVSRMRFSVGVDEKQDYFESLHGNAKVHEGFVESINWLLKKGDVIRFNEPQLFARQFSLDIYEDWLLDIEIISSAVTSEEHLDRFSYAEKPQKRSDGATHQLRSDCWREDVLQLDLSNLKEDEKRAYLGLAPRRGRKGLLEVNIELIVRLDRLEFTFVQQRPPFCRWRLRSFHPDEFEPFNQDEVTFQQPCTQTELQNEFQMSTATKTSGDEETCTSSGSARPGDKKIISDIAPSPSRQTFSASNESSSPADSEPILLPFKRTARKDRKSRILPAGTLAKRSYSGQEISSRKRAMSRSPTLLASVEDAHLSIDPFAGAISKFRMTPQRETDIFTKASPASRRPWKARYTDDERPQAQAQAQAQAHTAMNSRWGLESHRTSALRKATKNMPPPSSSGRSSPTALSSMDEQTLGEWAMTRPRRESAFRGNYRIKGLHEVEMDELSSSDELSFTK